MRIATNTVSCMKSRDSKALLGEEYALRMLHDAGYDTVDISFVFQDHDDFVLRADHWQQRVEDIGKTAETLGIKIHQCHLPYTVPHKLAAMTCEYRALYDECTRRAYIASGMLGVRWAVAHPWTHPELNFENKASLEANHAYYDPFIELGIQHNVGTALENMCPCLNREMPMRYCQHYDQLLELVDSFHDPMVGVCWDTGHANQMKLDQHRALLAVGSRLKALHINDNQYGSFDEHLLPYIGDNDWASIMEALVEIDYQGVLTYETGRVGRLAPYGEFQNAFLRATHESGMCMLRLYEETQKRLNRE